MPVRSSENNLAKNLLMDDHESDSDGAGGKKIKEEPKDPDDQVDKPKRPGPKSKTKVDNKLEPESLMLTADKMMNKELTLLHAPIVLQDAADTKETIVKQPSAKEESKPSKVCIVIGSQGHSKKTSYGIVCYIANMGFLVFIKNYNSVHVKRVPMKI